MLKITMTKIIFFLMTLSIFFTGCINKHGVSAKYYSDCKEYYDLQGYYHKECGEDDIFTYKEAKEGAIKVIKEIQDKKEPQKNVW
jgi:hypothetical protein